MKEEEFLEKLNQGSLKYEDLELFLTNIKNNEIENSRTDSIYNTNNGRTAPAYQANNGRTAPAYQSDSGRTAPAYQVDNGRTAPAYQADSGRTAPAYQADNGRTAPAYQADNGNNIGKQKEILRRKNIITKYKEQIMKCIDENDLVDLKFLLESYFSKDEVMTLLDKKIEENIESYQEDYFDGISDEQYLEENGISIWKELNSENSEKSKEKAKEFIRTLFDSKNINFLNNNIDELLQNTNIDNANEIYNYYKLLQMYDKFNDENKPIIDKFYDVHKREIAKNILQGKKQFNPKYKEEDIEKYADTMVQLLDELMESEDCRFSDVKMIGAGGYSNVYAIGDKILKIGEPRATYNVPNHKRIAQPFYRGNFENENGEPFACIEISEAVRVTDDLGGKAYEIYKELRDCGIIWADPKSANLGVLKNSNQPIYNGEIFEPNPQFNGLDGHIAKEDVLKERRNCNFRYRFFI